MVLLVIFTVMTVLVSLFVIWYIIYCYSNQWIASLVTFVLIAVTVTLLFSWFSKPTEQELRDHQYKVLHI